jgi:hypothetical protein
MIWSSDDRLRIDALVDFIEQETPNLNHGEYISSGKDFMKLVELVSNLPNRGIYFKVFEFVDGITRPVDYFPPDGIVSYLFEKIELYQWSIRVLQYYPNDLVSMNADKLDLVYVTVQPMGTIVV